MKEENHTGRILVADDESGIRSLLSYALSDAGYSVEAVANGAEAWQVLQGNHFDLLITDNKMPKMSGEQLIGKLHDSGSDLPVIMASATVPQGVGDSATRPAAVLHKPYDIAEVVETVNAMLRPLPQRVKEAVPADWLN